MLLVSAAALPEGCEDVGELGRDDEHPFGVGFGRHDLQQQEPFSGAGRRVGSDRGGREFEQLLDPDAGLMEHVRRGPAEERDVFRVGLIDAPGCVEVVEPDLVGVASLQQCGPAIAVPVVLERVAEVRCEGELEQFPLSVPVPLERGQQRRDRRGEQTDALMSAGLDAALVLHCPRRVGLAQEARRGPACPVGVVRGPGCDVVVKGADREQRPVLVDQWSCAESCEPAAAVLETDMEVSLLGVVLADIGPEVAQQLIGEAFEADVVQARGALHQVAAKQVADLGRLDIVERDDLLDALAPVRLDVLPMAGGVRLERSDCAQQFPGHCRTSCCALVGRSCGRFVQMRRRDLSLGQAGVGENAGEQPQSGSDSAGRHRGAPKRIGMLVEPGTALPTDDGIVDAFGVEIAIRGPEDIECDQRAQRRRREALLLVIGEVRKRIADPDNSPVRRPETLCIIPTLLPGNPIKSFECREQYLSRDHPPGGALPACGDLFEDLHGRPARDESVMGATGFA